METIHFTLNQSEVTNKELQNVLVNLSFDLIFFIYDIKSLH